MLRRHLKRNDVSRCAENRRKVCESPECGGVVDPGCGTSASPDDDGHGGANNPGQKMVRKRPEPVEDVEPVEPELDGRVRAGECAAPVPTALRYGKALETRPIFTRTVCHSHAARRPPVSVVGDFCCEPAGPGGRPRGGFLVNRKTNPKNFSGEALVQHFGKGAAILGCTQNALRRRRGCHETSPAWSRHTHQHTR